MDKDDDFCSFYDPTLGICEAMPYIPKGPFPICPFAKLNLLTEAKKQRAMQGCSILRAKMEIEDKEERPHIMSDAEREHRQQIETSRKKLKRLRFASDKDLKELPANH